MHTVDRHEADVDLADERGDALTEELTKLIDQNPTHLHEIGRKALAETGYHCVGDTEASWSHTWRSTVLAMQACTGIFAAATTTSADARFFLRDNDITVPATAKTADTNADTWLKAMYLSMICRERTRIDMLANAPEDLTGDDSWVKALKTCWLGGTGLVDLTLAAMRETDDPLRYPPVELFYRVTQHDQDGFTTSLLNALTLHKRYWTESPDRAASPDGFIALAPLALACFARDAGLEVRVRSEYLPGTLLGGGRVGEVTT